MYINGSRIGLREVSREDLEMFKIWRNVERDTVNYRTIGPIISQDYYWNNVILSDNHKVFTIVKRDNTEVIGEVRLSYINYIDGNAEIGILLNSKHRRQGFGKEAIKLITSFGFSRLRLHRIEAQYISTNTSSQKLFESCGFEIEGIRKEAKYFDGKYNDIIITSLLNI